MLTESVKKEYKTGTNKGGVCGRHAKKTHVTKDMGGQA